MVQLLNTVVNSIKDLGNFAVVCNRIPFACFI